MTENAPPQEPGTLPPAKPLTRMQRVFLESYLTCWNATEAARQAGYKNPNKLGPRLVKVGLIQDAIQQRFKDKAMSADEVLGRLADQARGSHLPFIRIHDGFVYFDFSDPEAQKYIHLIKKIKTKRTRRVEGRGPAAEEWEDEWVEVELYDSQAALQLIGRNLKLFSDQLDVDLKQKVTILWDWDKPQSPPDKSGSPT